MKYLPQYPGVPQTLIIISSSLTIRERPKSAAMSQRLPVRWERFNIYTPIVTTGNVKADTAYPWWAIGLYSYMLRPECYQYRLKGKTLVDFSAEEVLELKYPGPFP